MIKIIVAGGLHTDIVASRVERLLGPGEYTTGQELKIGPGGKSRNIAQMIAALTSPGSVAMIGKTTKDPFGLWRVPINALKAAGVNTEYIQIQDFSGTFPAIALIPVDVEGNNQIYVLPGINNSFSKEDIDQALVAFEEASKNSGVVALSTELPINTACYVLDKAKEYNLKVILDPGGIDKNKDYDELFRREIFLIKPNEHEAEIMSGVKVLDLKTAKQAAEVIMNFGIQNVLITAGINGAYLITESSAEHIPISGVSPVSAEKDETGCGDQTMATACVLIMEGKSVTEAARAGVISGTLQFYKSGIDPVSREELLPYIE